MRSITITIMLLLCLKLSLKAQNGPTTVNVTHDAFTQTLNPDTANGQWSYLTTQKLDAASSGSGYYRQTWLQFNLSAYDFSTTPNIVIGLYKSAYTPANGATDVSIYDVADNNWTENSITYNNRPTTAANPIATQSISAEGWVYWDVTAHVNAAMANGRTVFSFMLKNTGGNTGENIGFVSSESGTVANRPKLVAGNNELVPTELTKIANHDAFTEAQYPDTNRGQNSYLLTRNLDITTNYSRQTWLQFDLTGNNLTNTPNIVVGLYKDAYTPTNGATEVGIFDVSDNNWTESSITYNNRPNGVGSTPIATQSISTEGWVYWDVTSHVNAAMAQGRRIFSFMLKNTGGNAGEYISFVSSEGSANKPKFVINFTNETVPTNLNKVANHDAFTEAQNPNTANGQWSYLITRNLDITTNYSRQTWLQFDLTGNNLTNTPNIVVGLYKSAYTPTNGATEVGIFDVTDNNWTEGTITYNNRPNGVGSTPIATQSISAEGWVYWDVTAHVNAAMAQGRRIFSFMLKNTGANSEQYMGYESSEATNKPVIKTTETQPGGCSFAYSADLALPASVTQAQRNEIAQIHTRLKNIYMEDVIIPLTSCELQTFNSRNPYTEFAITGRNQSAVSTNNALPINTVGLYIRDVIKYLEHENPTAAQIAEKREEAISLIHASANAYCTNTYAAQGPGNGAYYHSNMMLPALLYFNDDLSSTFVDTMVYALNESHSLQHLWPIQGQAFPDPGGVDTDLVHGFLETYLAIGTQLSDERKQVQWLNAVKRYLGFIMTYTDMTRSTLNTTNSHGIKFDGAAIHHHNSYIGYTYAYRAPIKAMHALIGSSYQITETQYNVFRDAIFFNLITSNDANLIPLSRVGRNPQNRYSLAVDITSLMRMVEASQDIRSSGTYDNTLARHINRRYGTQTQLSSLGTEPFEQGTFQSNYSNSLVNRHQGNGRNWVATAKGFTSELWGSEIYVGTNGNSNWYGRYQSYGTLEILYPGTHDQNGILIQSYNPDPNTCLTPPRTVKAWDWNFNPGATTIERTFPNLKATQYPSVQFQDKSFVGALALGSKSMPFLTDYFRTYGMFAMDFDSQSYNNYDATFKFKKSVFTFGDIMVALGAGISNATNLPTVTTLFQRATANQPNNVVLNGNNQTATTSASQNSDNWVLSNYGTGFYVVNGSGDVKLRIGNQTTPNDRDSGSDTESFAIGYLDHGNAPTNKSYEYVVLPDRTSAQMATFSTNFTSNKPYTVYSNTANAQIVKHNSLKVWGYALYTTGQTLPTQGIVTNYSMPCMVMYQEFNNGNSIRISVTDPDDKHFILNPSMVNTINITLVGEWSLSAANADVSIVSSNATSTVVQFISVNGKSPEVVLNKNNQSKQSNSKTLSTIENDIIENNLMLYPNPGKDIVTISSNMDIREIKVIDVSGRLIKTINLSNPSKAYDLSIDYLPDGMYFLKVSETKTVETKVLIVKK